MKSNGRTLYTERFIQSGTSDGVENRNLYDKSSEFIGALFLNSYWLEWLILIYYVRK
jgi:hypothetical protein